MILCAELTGEMLLAAGQIGEIIVRGDVVTRAYQNNPEETRLAKIEDGGTLVAQDGRCRLS